MKTNLFRQLKYLMEVLQEKILEWCAMFRNIFRDDSDAARNITVTYSMKQEYSNAEFVRNFLGERTRIAAYNGYQIIFDNEFTSDVKEEIGRVTLTCKGRYIDHATLIAGEATGKDNRLIHWKFNKEAIS